MDEKNFLALFTGGKNQLEKIQACNEYTQKFGLTLSKEDALVLVKDRKESLKEQQRVEFGDSILPKIIFTFCDSPYIYQENYVDSIGKLQEIFYLFKNESLDEVTDDELLDYMKDAFENRCQGSLEYLEDTILERFARNIRRGSHQFMGRIQQEEDMEEEQEEAWDQIRYRGDVYEDDYE